MSSTAPRSPRPASTGPTPLLVQHASAVLVIGPLLPRQERPLQADATALERFAALMAEQGWTAHVSAMAFDRIYARERFAWAHRRGNAELKALAEELLICHRRGWPQRPR
ncbi:MAG TPA: hypothetical protein VF169_04075 [Albitalea sp.]|uniref:hypothetical protein n=1 Tax=Piscinibacter sp. TaxID=1903157 RepID=UPI002ED4E5C0